MSKGNPIALAAAEYIAEQWCKEWHKLEPDACITVCGSIRRKEKMVRDIDLLIIDEGKSGTLQNDTKFKDVMMNLYWTNDESFGAGLLFLTGSAALNIRLRSVAKGKGMKLNRYGLWKDDKCIASKTEEDIFKALGMEFIDPKHRGDPDSEDKGIQIRSSGATAKWYEVFIADVHGFNFCNCRGFQYRQQCKHLALAGEKV